MQMMQKASPALKSDAAPQAADSDVALADIARHLRMRVIEMSHAAKTAHLASSLSCCDILAAAYWRVLKLDPANPGMATRDRFILSKGHAASALYAALAFRGYFPEALLDTFTKDGGKLAEHPPAHGLPGVEAATGSLGHGLPIGVGMALAARIQGTGLPRLRRAVRRRVQRGLGVGGGDVRRRRRSSTTSAPSSTTTSGRRRRAPTRCWPSRRCATSGRRSAGTPSRSTATTSDALAALMAATPRADGRPTAIVAHTVKGKGVSFMEDDNNWHYRAPTADEVEQARRELGLA